MQLHQMVMEFHQQHNFAVGERLDPQGEDLRHSLDAASALLQDARDELDSTMAGASVKPGEIAAPNRRRLALARASLMIEELTELIEALRSGSELQLADGLADLMYCVVGTGVAYGIPVELIFQEVHRSNMTKTPGDKHKVVKGPGYSPPDISGVLERWRATQ